MEPTERIAVLETQIKHMDVELLNISRKVDEMHAMLTMARGFRWALAAFIGVVSFGSGAILPWFLLNK